MKDTIKINLNVKLYEFPGSFTYETIQKLSNQELESFKIDEGNNRVVDAGMNNILDNLIAAIADDTDHCQTGSGTNAPAAGDTDLQTPIAPRLVITNRYRVGLNAHFDTFYGTADGNGTWEETGLFNALTSGTLMVRRTFASTFVKATTNTALIAWTITLAAVP